MIHKTHGSLSYTVSDKLPTKVKEVLKYAVEQFSFIMYPRSSFSFGELAEQIAKDYDTSNSVTRACVEALKIAQANQ